MEVLRKFGYLVGVSLILMVLASPCAGRTSASLRLAEDLRAGRISREEAVLYTAYALFDPSRVPQRYLEEGTIKCGTPMIEEIRSKWHLLSSPARSSLVGYFSRRPREYSYVSPSGHYRIHYDLSGGDAVDPSDADADGLPDYVELVAATFDSVWSLEIDRLGYAPPLSDEAAGGGEEYDIYVLDLSPQRVYGYTVPERSGQRYRSVSFIQVDNNYTDRVYEITQGLDALRVTAAHEFFHAIQYSYYNGDGMGWWMEATATWMEDVAYDEVNDYYQYLDVFFSEPTEPLDRFSGGMDIHPNGACIFVHYLVGRPSGTIDVVRHIWERISTQHSSALSLFDEAIPGGFREAMAEFARWNYFTGARARPEFYRDGADYPEMATRAIHLDATARAEGSGFVDRLACDYLRLRPEGMKGGARVYLRGGDRATWKMQVLLLRTDAYQVQNLSDTLTVPKWDQYDEIVLIPVVTSWTGSGDSYSYAVRFDPTLTDSLASVASRLMPPRPHPFRLSPGAHVRFPFELARYAQGAQLSIFTDEGELMHRVEYERPLSTGEHARVFEWDGTNDRGYRVGSGLYFYRIDADAFSGSGKLMVIRER